MVIGARSMQLIDVGDDAVESSHWQGEVWLPSPATTTLFPTLLYVAVSEDARGQRTEKLSLEKSQSKHFQKQLSMKKGNRKCIKPFKKWGYIGPTSE